MEQWTEVRRRVLTGELSKHAACREYDISWHTLAKMLTSNEPPGYRQRKPRGKPILGPFLPILHEILEADKKARISNVTPRRPRGYETLLLPAENPRKHGEQHQI
ncbi:hypothetical protein [Adhaeretor mobilis]|uniref:Uncharacterized protein n=1 Tax=Adhaeretor mobilis TaxID=1930276 RepID=A0A517MXG6_9BACT|nr:hypothetical protein [Adhaeretor mobilis]QDS99572.1 hypothetical protein HG15A2_28970 [Adhaeretor mobilis]